MSLIDTNDEGPEPFYYPPTVCPHCKFRLRFSMAHRPHCPTMRPDEPACHEVAPGLFVGSVEARVDRRFVAVVSILSEADARYVGARVAMPSVPMFHVEHEDQGEGLLVKCEPAWRFVDEHRAQGPVLFHCLQGANRSPTAYCGYRITRDRVSAEAILLEVLARRPPSWYVNRTNVEGLLALARAPSSEQDSAPVS